MRSCREVSLLLSESLDRKLSFSERIGLWIHLSMCKFCRGLSRDLLRLREAAGRFADETESSGTTLSLEARQRMQQVLEGRGL